MHLQSYRCRPMLTALFLAAGQTDMVGPDECLCIRIHSWLLIEADKGRCRPCNQLTLNDPPLDDHPGYEVNHGFDSSSDGNAIRAR